MSGQSKESRDAVKLKEARTEFMQMAELESLFGNRPTLPKAGSLTGSLTASMISRLKASDEIIVITVHARTASVAYYVYV